MSFGRGANLGSAHGSILLDGSSAKRATDQVVASLRTMQTQGAAASRSLMDIQGSLNRTAQSFQTFGRVAATAIAGLGIERAINATRRATEDLDEAVRNVQSITPGLGFDQTFDRLQDVADRIPEQANQLGEGLFNIFSSIETSFDKGVVLLEQFGRGAVAARTDTETFGTALLGVLNAFNKDVSEAEHVSDIFFNTVKFGVVTGAELARNLGLVTSGAKAAGLTVEELGAAIAVVTKQGGPAAQNINNLANLFNKIVTADAADEMAKLGVRVATAAGDFRPFIDILTDLDARLRGMSEAARAAALQEIFPDFQARQGARTLMNQLDLLRRLMIANETQAGSTQAAYEIMAGSLKNTAQLLRNAFTNVLTDIGRAALPQTVALLRGLTVALQNVRKVLPDLGTAAGQAFARLGNAGQDVGKLEGVLNRLFGVGSPVTAGFSSFLDTVRNLGGALASGLQTLVAQLTGLTLPLESFGRAFTAISRLLSANLFPRRTADELSELEQRLQGTTGQAEEAVGPIRFFAQGVRNILTAATNTTGFQRLIDAIGRMRDGIAGALGAIGRFIGVFTGNLVPQSAQDDIDDLAGALVRFATSNPVTQAGIILQAFADAAGGLSNLVNGAVGALQALTNVLDGMGRQIAASGAIDRLRDSLAPLADLVKTLLAPARELFDQLGTGLKAVPPRSPVGGLIGQMPGMDEERTKILDAQAKAAETAGGAIIRVLNAISDALDKMSSISVKAEDLIAKLNQRLTDTGTKEQSATVLDKMWAALVRVGQAPFVGISAGLRDIHAELGFDGEINLFTLALKALASVAEVVVIMLEALAFIVERSAFAIGRFMAAIERLSLGDAAGAIAELGQALESFKVKPGPGGRDITSTIWDPEKFAAVKRQAQKDLDALSASVGGFFAGLAKGRTIQVTIDSRLTLSDLDRIRRGIIAIPSVVISADTSALDTAVTVIRSQVDDLAGQPVILSITTTAAQFEADLARANKAIAALPNAKVVTLELNIAPLQTRLTEVSRMLPHSPADTGPLAFTPDWSFILANLPDVLNEMIDLVTRAGKAIGAEKQIEHFTSIANALSAAAGAIGATVAGLTDVATFVRPTTDALNSVVDALAEAVVAFKRLGASLSPKEAERIEQIAGAGSAAMQALGVAVETLTNLRDFEGPAIDRVKDVIDHTTGVLVRLREMGEAFSGPQLTKVRTIGEAAGAAFAGLGAALEPLQGLRSFVGPAIGQVEDLINHVSGVLVRLDTLGLAFDRTQLERAEALGHTVQAAMEGLQVAVEALESARTFIGFDPGLLDKVFDLVSNVAVRFRDLSLAFTQEQAAQAGRVAEAVRASFEALQSALDVLPTLAESDLPDIDAQLNRLASAIQASLLALQRVGDAVGVKATEAVAKFATDARTVIDLLGSGTEAFNRLADLQEVSTDSIARFAVGVRQAVIQLQLVAADVGHLLTKEAVRFSEDVTKALGVFGAAASLSALNTFVAPSSRQFQRFFAALRVAVDGLVAEAARVAPDIARRTGQVGEDLGKAMGAVGTAINAFAALTQFKPGKNFEAQIAGVLHFLRITLERMIELARAFGDTRELDRFAASIEAVARALSAFVNAAAGIADTKNLAQAVEVARNLSGLPAGITARTEHIVRFEGGFTISVNADTDTAQTIGDKVTEAVKDEIVGRSVEAVRLAFVGAAA